MMKRLITIILVIATLGYCAEAQRRITPVNPQLSTPKTEVEKKNGKEEVDLSRYVEARDEFGNVFLVDSVTGKEYVDSAALKEKDVIKYPKFHELTFGVNIWDPVMRVLGQKYGGAEAWAELSIHNRFKPIVEVGFGMADATPDDGNYTYKNSAVPYFRLGMNYNFLFKKITDYQFYAGLRYGFSSFSYELTNVTMDSGYWNEPEAFNIPSQKSTVGYLEISCGLKVKIYKNFYLGWALKYHSILHESNNKYGKPWYIPGFGTRGNSLTGAFSLMYTIPINRKSVTVVDVADPASETTHPDQSDTIVQ